MAYNTILGVNSLGERLNFDNASTKANAGSQYHFDSKVGERLASFTLTIFSSSSQSVHTVCSSAEAGSYCEEVEAVSVGANSKHARSSRPERDLSPSSIYSLNEPRSSLIPAAAAVIGAPSQPSIATASSATSESAEHRPAAGTSTAAGERFHLFMDNLRQILSDDVPTSNEEASKSTRSHVASRQRKT